MADFLDEKRSEIAVRLKELKPLVDEYQRLEAAAAALDGVPPNGSAPRRPRPRAAAAGPHPRRSAGSRRTARPLVPRPPLRSGVAHAHNPAASAPRPTVAA